MPNLVARDAASRGGTTSDFADFIRNGPDGGGPVTGKNKPLPSGPSARSRSPGPVSAYDSIRKTRVRPKDPYAIDISDEEDDEDFDEPVIQAASPPTIAAPVARRASPGPQRTLSSGALNTLNANGAAAASASRSVSPAPGVAAAARTAQAIPRSTSSLSNRNSHPALSGGLVTTPGTNVTRRFKLEARPAGATRGFGGHGYYYSTTDMADFLRSSGPGDDFASRATTANGHANGNGYPGRPGSNGGINGHPVRGLSRGGLGEFEYTMWRD
jgi:hypothetical protein